MNENEFEGDPREELNQELQAQLEPGQYRIVESPSGVGFILTGNDYDSSGKTIGLHDKYFPDERQLARYLQLDEKSIHDGLIVRKPEDRAEAAV